MKKVLLLSASALALSAGAAFAQTSAPTGFATQTSDTGSILPGATAPNSNVSFGNSSTIEQVGTNNQLGTSPWANGVDQQVLDIYSGNYSEIHQGTAAGAGTTSSYARATVTQTASNGGTTSSLVNQDDGGKTNDGFWTYNEAYTTQIVTASGLVQSSISQSGANLKANVSQNVAGSASSNIQQTGTSGSVNVNQTSIGATSVVIQDGTGNGNAIPWETSNVNVQQTGTGTNNSAVDQTKLQSGGTVAINQGGGSTSSTNNSVVSQSSGTGSVTVNQNVAWAGDNVSSNNSGVLQNGSGGIVTINQSGSDGLLNTSSVVQTSGDTTSFASITQSGTGAGYNTSYVNQMTGSGQDQATVIQTANAGFENYSDLTQSGGATAYLSQTSSNAANWSSIAQSGGANIAYVRQR